MPLLIGMKIMLEGSIYTALIPMNQSQRLKGLLSVNIRGVGERQKRNQPGKSTVIFIVGIKKLPGPRNMGIVPV